MPFGGGVNRCLGGNLAMFEARVLLREILQQRAFAPDSSPDERMVQHKGIMMLPGDGARVTLRRC